MDDLKLIKKYYGENMMHLCRELFSTILEKDGLLFKLISENFDYSKLLYDDIVDNHLDEKFKNYIFSLIDVENNYKEYINKTPQELMDEAGYILYECKTYEEVERFRKYYESDEELCTFRNVKGRLNRCRVFFAVKKDVDNIKRKDFNKPNRQDLYGTSVISIQFTKGKINTLSIKNRYNHTVNNPDATFSNNLENIKVGLTKSFEKKYNLNINSNKSNFEIKGYVKANDGKFYKYNHEINNIYYCPNNIIIDNFEVKKYDKERYIILDYFILDMKEKIIKLYDKKISDSFIDGLSHIESIEIEKLENKKIIINKEIQIIIDKVNTIIDYNNSKITLVRNLFLHMNKALKQLELPKLQQVGDDFLRRNETLSQLELPNLQQVGDCFLFRNETLTQLELPNLQQVGNKFLYLNEALTQLELPNLQQVGDYFLCSNETLKQLELPNLQHVGYNFLYYNNTLTQLKLPNLQQVGDYFLCSNETLKQLELPNLQHVGDSFLYYNNTLTQLELPNLQQAGYYFLYYNNTLTQLKLPSLQQVGFAFLEYIKELEVLDVPEHIKERLNIKEIKAKVKQKSMKSYVV